MANIETRVLGRTGARVTSLGYGSWELRGPTKGREVSDEDAGRILNAVLDAGINLIDTAIDYGEGEERIGRHISHRRNEYFLAAKCGCLAGLASTDVDSSGMGPHVFTRANIIEGVEQSLHRLQTDHLDLLQLHHSPSKQVMEEHDVIRTLREIQMQGKTRFIGMSGTIPNLAEQIAMGAFDAFQIPYSCVQRETEELISRAADAGAGILVRGGAARGAPSDSEWTNGRNEKMRSTWDDAKLDDLFDGGTAMEFVLRFTASHPGMTTNIVGTVDLDHLADNIAALAKGSLPADVYEEAKRRLAAAGSAPASPA